MKKTLSLYVPWLIIIGIILFLLPHSPIFTHTIGDDTGVFLYNGWRLTQGDILYKNIWDHKPPLIHFLNAAAVLITPNSLWGLWLLQLFFLVSAFTLAWKVLTTLFDFRVSFITILSVLSSLIILLGEGNHTQDYALLLQFACLFLYIKQKETNKLFYSYAIGLCGSTIFFLQPNILAIYVGIILYELFEILFNKTGWKKIICNSIGFFTIAMFFLGYFLSQNNLQDFLNAVFEYNLAYSNISGTSVLLTLYIGLLLNLSSLLSFFAIGGWISAILNIVRKKTVSMHPVEIVAIISFPIELFLVSMAGRSNMYYYLSWLPVFSILSAIFIKKFKLSFILTGKYLFFIFYLIFLFSIPLYVFYLQMSSQMKANLIIFNRNKHIISFIQNSTTNNDSVLFWGIEPRINFLVKRKSGSRFSYQYPLFTKNFVNQKLINDFISDLEKNKPIYIIDAPIINGYMPSLDTDRRARWTSPLTIYTQTKEVDNIYLYISKHYSFEKKIDTWSIYKRMN